MEEPYQLTYGVGWTRLQAANNIGSEYFDNLEDAFVKCDELVKGINRDVQPIIEQRIDELFDSELPWKITIDDSTRTRYEFEVPAAGTVEAATARVTFVRGFGKSYDIVFSRTGAGVDKSFMITPGSFGTSG
jgi:hypothetical protein